MEAVIDFLAHSGALGILSLCLLVGLGVVWAYLVKQAKRNDDARERREAKHDADRDDWLKSYKELLESYSELVKTNASNQERIVSSLNSLEKAQSNLYDIYHELVHTKK